MKRGTKVLVCMSGSVLHNAPATIVRQNSGGSTVLKLAETRGAYRAGDLLNVGPGEFSELFLVTL